VTVPDSAGIAAASMRSRQDRLCPGPGVDGRAWSKPRPSLPLRSPPRAGKARAIPWCNRQRRGIRGPSTRRNHARRCIHSSMAW